MNGNGIKLEHYIGREQLRTIRMNCRGEEGEYFRHMLWDLKDTIAAMPQTYQTDGTGDTRTCHLHYFTGGCDWWIVERDAGSPDDEEPGRQDQAYGYTCLNGDTENAEEGYISLPELFRAGAELDLYWKPVTLGDIKAKLEGRVIA